MEACENRRRSANLSKKHMESTNKLSEEVL